VARARILLVRVAETDDDPRHAHIVHEKRTSMKNFPNTVQKKSKKRNFPHATFETLCVNAYGEVYLRA
jgi:hypothetical protein